MSMIARETSFYPAGKTAWQGGLPPCWRGGPAPVVDMPPPPGHWWHEDALLACDFESDRHMRGGQTLAATALLTTTRSSGIALPGAAGVIQSLGNNILPRTDRGLYANGQFTQSAVNWSAPANESLSLGTGTYRLAVWGEGSVAVAAGTATGSGFGEAGEGNAVTFVVSGAGTISLTVSGAPDYVSVTNSSFALPAPQATGPVFASDIRAVPGIRPSTSQPEPFPGWEAAGLDEGFTVLLDLNCASIVFGTLRVPFSLNPAGNSPVVRLEVTTGGTWRARSTTDDGTTNVNLPGSAPLGRARVGLRLADGVLGATQAGAGTIATSAAHAPLPMTRLIVGNNATLMAPWNDWIYSLQICRPLSDTQLLDWVNAA